MDLLSAYPLALVLLIIALWVRWRREHFSIFKRNGIPGPEPSFWFGNFKKFAEKQEECILEYTKKYGNIFGFFLGAKPLLIVTDPELIKTIQVKEFPKFTDRDMILRDAGVPHSDMLEGLFPSRGESWKAKRNLISPSFSISKIKKIMPIAEGATNTFLEKIREGCSKEFINIAKVFKNLSLDIITKTVLGVDTNAQNEEDINFLVSTRNMLATSPLQTLPKISLFFPEIEPLPTKLRNILDHLNYNFGLPSAKIVFKQVQGMINYRRKNPQKREDVLQTLIDMKADYKKMLFKNANEPPASDESGNKQVNLEEPEKGSSKPLLDNAKAANAINLVIAGYDTTNIALSFIAYYLAKHQDIQERLREEINTQLGEKKEITYDDIGNLRYLEQIISEILRLHPTNMAVITRIATEAMNYKGMSIPKGMTIVIPLYSLHRSPNIWPQADVFDPERFSPENKAGVNPYIYQPFGVGPRICVGMRMAQLVLRLTITKLVQSYRLKSYDGKKPEVCYALFLTTPKKLLLKIEPISQ